MKKLQLPGQSLARVALRVAALLAIGTPLAFAETPGEYFRNYMAKRDAECKELQLGPYMPADEPPLSPRRGNHSCHSLFLKPWWENLDDAGKFAHSIKLPPPHDKLPDVYKPGMSPREYFDALCAAQAGEFIFKTVSDIEGIVELRPRMRESTLMDRHLTAFEDPATFTLWQHNASKTLPDSGVFQFIETTQNGRKVRVHRSATLRDVDRKVEAISEYSSPIGFVWRGINDQRQLELGVAGGELIILNFSTQEILGVKRGFKLRWIGRYPWEQRQSVTGVELGGSCVQEIAAVRSGNHQDWRDFMRAVVISKDAKKVMGESH